MGIENEYLEILVRVAVTIVTLLIFTRLDGSKQISQLTFFDYIIGITVGSMAGAVAIDTTMPLQYGVIAIAIYMLVGVSISFLTNKSIVMRRIFTGKPVILIANGQIMYKGLKRARFDMNDLTSELRIQGYFDITQVNYAILEPSGNVSIMPKSFARTPQLADMGIAAQEGVLPSNVIIDGKIMHGNLEAYGKNEDWLYEQLKSQGYDELKPIAIATMTPEGENLSVLPKNEEDTGRTVII